MPEPSDAMTTPPPLVVPLRALDRADLSLAGGKAANLGEMLRGGLPVPDGFCVTTAAYAEVAAGAGIGPLLDELAATPATDGERLRELAARVAAALRDAPIPPGIVRAIREAAGALGPETPVAVRSSATAEDLPFASFAGLQDTMLHVVGSEAVLAAVRRCWASLWTERATVYRARNGIDQRGVRLAVVVQRMVDARMAGVLFTADPIDGRRGRAVIDASFGLGEAVVSGAVNPDHYAVDAATGTILERRLGDKRVAIVAETGGGVRRVVAATDDDRSALSDGQLRELARLGQRAEALFGSPQDVEFAIDAEGAIWLVQSRPITTLFPLPADAPRDPDDLRVYFSINVAQGVFRPFTPMGEQALRMFASAAAGMAGVPPADAATGPGVLHTAANRLFLDATGAVRSKPGRRVLLGLLGQGEARSADLLRPLTADPRLAVRPTPRRAFVVAARLLAATRLPLRVVGALANPARARGRLQALETAIREDPGPPPDAGVAARIGYAERALLRWPPRILAAALPVMLAGVGSFALANRLLGDLATADERDAVKRALPHNPTTEMDLALWDLARQAAADPEVAAWLRGRSAEDLARDFARGAVPDGFGSAFAAFLARYGHRAVAEIDLGVPRWAEDPAPLFTVLANHLRLEPGQAPPDARFREAARRAEATAAEISERAARRSPWRGRAVRFLLGRGRELAGLREMPKFLFVLLLARVRADLARVGDDLARVGRIDRGDDVFFLTLPELRRLAAGSLPDPRGLVRERRARHAEEMRRRHVPRLLLSDGTEPAEPAAALAERSGVLRGAAASAGRVAGRARVVFDPATAHLDPGDILVAPSTDPGWTPLFLTAGGLVMEMGGAMSHGSVVAREYGIPAVVGVAGATGRIRDGQRVVVDGTAGTVELLAEQPQPTVIAVPTVSDGGNAAMRPGIA